MIKESFRFMIISVARNVGSAIQARLLQRRISDIFLRLLIIRRERQIGVYVSQSRKKVLSVFIITNSNSKILNEASCDVVFMKLSLYTQQQTIYQPSCPMLTTVNYFICTVFISLYGHGVTR